MTGLGPPLPPRLTPLVGVIVCNARAAPRPTPAGAPGPLQREPRAKEANYFLIVDTDNLTVSLPHNSCPPVYSRVSVDPSFPSFFFFSGPPRCLQSLMHTGAGLFFFPSSFSCLVGKIFSVLLTLLAYQRGEPLTIPPRGTATTGGCEGVKGHLL